MSHITDVGSLAPARHVDLAPPPGAAASPTTAPKGRRHPTARRTMVLCVLSYVALAVLAYLPVGPFDSRALPIAGPFNPAGSDPFQMTWFLSWVPYALTHGQSLFHTNFIDYPSGVNLAGNTSVPLLGVLGWPITATLGPVAAFNFLVRLSFALSATSMFFVMRRWCRSWQAPFVAGLLYAFGPYTAAQNLHLDLIFIPFPPVLVLLADELVRRQRMRPWLTGALIGVVGALQYLVSPDVFSGVSAIGIIAAVALALRFRHEVRSRFAYIATSLPFALVGFGLLAGYPILEMLVGPAHLRGPVIPVNSLQITRADLLGPVVPTSNQLAVPWFISHIGDYFVDGNLSENGSYLGIPLLILLVVITRRLRRDAVVMTFAFLAVAAFVLSLGSYLVIGTWHSPVPLPEYIYAHLPLLQNTIPARYSLYVLLFASMILGIGLDRLLMARKVAVGASADGGPLRQRTGLRSPRLRIGAIAAVVVISLIPSVPFRSRGLLWPASFTAAIERVVPKGAVVVTYPFATPASTQPMAWQAIDHMDFRLMGGYANINVPGSTVGQRWPLLLSPASVEEVLGYAAVGDRFPPPQTPTRASEAQLPQFLNRYAVGAVVAWIAGGGPNDMFMGKSAEYLYLERALGAPRVAGRGFAIWLPSHSRWPPPST